MNEPSDVQKQTKRRESSELQPRIHSRKTSNGFVFLEFIRTSRGRKGRRCDPREFLRAVRPPSRTDISARCPRAPAFANSGDTHAAFVCSPPCMLPPFFCCCSSSSSVTNSERLGEGTRAAFPYPFAYRLDLASFGLAPGLLSNAAGLFGARALHCAFLFVSPCLTESPDVCSSWPSRFEVKDRICTSPLCSLSERKRSYVFGLVASPRDRLSSRFFLFEFGFPVRASSRVQRLVFDLLFLDQLPVPFFSFVAAHSGCCAHKKFRRLKQ